MRRTALLKASGSGRRQPAVTSAPEPDARLEPFEARSVSAEILVLSAKARSAPMPNLCFDPENLFVGCRCEEAGIGLDDRDGNPMRRS